MTSEEGRMMKREGVGVEDKKRKESSLFVDFCYREMV
jgi:hypothetical protein